MSQNPIPAPRSLQSTLTRGLFMIAMIVILLNILVVAYFETSNRNDLILELTRREVLRLEREWVDAGGDPARVMQDGIGIYTDFPEAYAAGFFAPDGSLIAGQNTAIIHASLLEGNAPPGDWITWPAGIGSFPVLSSHQITGSDPPVRVLFFMTADPARLVRSEIWDEFKGHVLMPLVPIAAILILGALYFINRALIPVKRAARWAQDIQPGRPHATLDMKDAPLEVVDLTDAVRRGIERLDAELSAEQRRAAEAAHALRTPVAVLVARMDDLPAGDPFDTLRTDIRDLSRMVTQYLSSAGADRLEIGETQTADLNAVGQKVAAEMAPLALAHGADLAFTRTEDAMRIRGDSDALVLALSNLVENAIQHGGDQIEIAVGPGPQITVADNGPGLPATDPHLLFQPFRRGPGAVRGGAGLGLAIVNRVQQAHGGSVTAMNRPEGGALFRLYYPAEVSG
jgi:two-component system, OmpR family, sensor kinase